MNDEQRWQAEATLAVVKIVANAIRALGSVPSGQLYGQVMGHMTIHTYDSIIGTLKRAGLVDEKAHLLTWIGPRES